MTDSASIYAKQHPKIRQLFEQAGSLRRVLCVALDYAKGKHVALFCNGFGDVLKKPFPVDNSPQGVQMLLQEVHSSCAHRGIKLKHVFFGGEDSPAYVQNFTQALRAKDYLVVRVNAWEAKHQRDNNQASTDTIDVYGVAKTLLTKASYADADGDGSAVLHSMREISRTRAYFVAQATEQKLQIHHYVERLCPGFLDEKKSGITPFSQACLALLSHGFCTAKLQQWRRDRLVDFLRRHGQDQPEAAAQQLKELVGQVLAPAQPLVACWQTSLSQYVLQYQSLRQSVDALEKELAPALAQTAGAFLTSVSGVGVVLASGILSELGEPTDWRGLKSLSSYCGIVPRSQQSGGPDKPAQQGKVQRRCNRRAKNWIVQAGGKMGTCGPAELKAQYQQLERNGQHADFVMSKRLLRLFKDLMRRNTVYRPKSLLAQDTPPAQLIAYYLELWEKLLKKWQGLVSWEMLVDTRYPLGQWRQMVEQLHHISLPVPKIKASKAP